MTIIDYIYLMMIRVGINNHHDKVLHFLVMVLVLSFGIPLAIWLSGMNIGLALRYFIHIIFNASPSDRDFGQMVMLILSQIAIFYKEHKDGWVPGWFFDVMAGEAGVFIGFVIGGGVIARLLV